MNNIRVLNNYNLISFAKTLAKCPKVELIKNDYKFASSKLETLHKYRLIKK